MQVNSTQGSILRDVPLKRLNWLRIEFLILKYFLSPPRPYFFLLMIKDGLNTSSAWVGQDYALLRGHLWPKIPVSPVSGPLLSSPSETGLEHNLKNRTLHSCSDQTNMTTILCPLLLFLSLCVHIGAPPSSLLCKGGDGLREGRASIVLPPTSCLSLAFLTCVPLVYPFPLSCPLPEEFLQLCSALPASPGRPLPPHSLKWERGMQPLGRPPSDCAKGPRWVLRWTFLEPC